MCEYLHAIGNNIGTCMCNYNEIISHVKEISLKRKVLLTDEWMDVLNGRTERLSLAFII